MKSIGKVIAKRRKEKKLSQADLALKLEKYNIYIKNAAISTWEKDVNTPTAYQLLAVCEILDITDIYSEFIGNNKKDLLAGLNNKGKQRAMEYIKLLLQSSEFQEDDQENKDKVIQFKKEMPVALLPASAGLGEYIDKEKFEMIEVENNVPETAEFGVRLSGDSMEPLFHNGDIVWIQKTQDLNSGDIGLFYLDGMTYCKKLIRNSNEIKLVSINPCYNPIIVTENSHLKVYGRVVN